METHLPEDEALHGVHHAREEVRVVLGRRCRRTRVLLALLRPRAANTGQKGRTRPSLNQRFNLHFKNIDVQYLQSLLPLCGDTAHEVRCSNCFGRTVVDVGLQSYHIILCPELNEKSRQRVSSDTPLLFVLVFTWFLLKVSLDNQEFHLRRRRRPVRRESRRCRRHRLERTEAGAWLYDKVSTISEQAAHVSAMQPAKIWNAKEIFTTADACTKAL